MTLPRASPRPFKRVEKKRKLDSTLSERPAKKPSREVPTVKIINYQPPSSNGPAFEPILMSTPGLEISKKASFTAYRNPNKDLLLYAKPHLTSTLEYTAQPPPPTTSRTFPYKDYLAVYSPASQTLTFVAAASLELRRTFRPTDQDVSSAAAPEHAQTPNWAQRQALGLEFGSKRAKKLIASRTTNAIGGPPDAGASQSQNGTTNSASQNKRSENADPLTRAVLESMSDALSSLPTREMMQADADDAKPRPKPNLEAKEVKEVYKIETLINANELLMVNTKDWEEAFRRKVPITSTSRYVADRFMRVMAEENEVKIRTLKYLLGLLQFWQSLIKTGGRSGASRKVPDKAKLNEVIDLNEYLVSKISEKFSVDRRTSDKWHQEYLLGHICVLSLLIDDFETETFDLVSDLGLDNREMAKHYKEIGAMSSNLNERQLKRLGLNKSAAANRRMVTLQLPLVFPKATGSRRSGPPGIQRSRIRERSGSPQQA